MPVYRIYFNANLHGYKEFEAQNLNEAYQKAEKTEFEEKIYWTNSDVEIDSEETERNLTSEEIEGHV
jgi:hypothetical protein